jgi:hypothetical protein
MALAVVAYPKLDPKDAEWIEAIRAEHDPLSRDIIAAHITLVGQLVCTSPLVEAFNRALCRSTRTTHAVKLPGSCALAPHPPFAIPHKGRRASIPPPGDGF